MRGRLAGGSSRAAGTGRAEGRKALEMAGLGKQGLRLLHSVQGIRREAGSWSGGKKEAESGGWKQPSLPRLAGQ